MKRFVQARTWLLLCIAALGTTAGAAPVNVRIRDASGTAVQDAIVAFDPLDSAQELSGKPPESVIDQINRQFVPRVSVVRAGTSISFPNGDHVRHQVYSFSSPKLFTLKLYAGSPKVSILFDKPGLVVLGCNIHDSMVAFVIVVDTPYFAKSPADGSVGLELPPGRYAMRVWHEKATRLVAAKTMTVATTPLLIPVTLELGESSGAPAAWDK